MNNSNKPGNSNRDPSLPSTMQDYILASMESTSTMTGNDDDQESAISEYDGAI